MSENFDDYIAGEILKPRFTYRIDLDDTLANPIYIKSHTDSQVPPGATVIEGRVIEAGSRSQTLVPYGISSPGNIRVSVLNADNAIFDWLRTSLQNGDSIRLRRIQEYEGDQGMDWDEYRVQATGLMAKLTFENDVYIFEAFDITKDLLDKEIFPEIECRLLSTIHENQSSFDVSADSGAKTFTSQAIDWTKYDVGAKVYMEDLSGSNDETFFTVSSRTANVLTVNEAVVTQAAGSKFTVHQGTIEVDANISKFSLDWHDAAYSDAPSQDVVYINVGSTLIRAETIDVGGKKFNNCVHGVLGSASKLHEVDTTLSDDKKVKVTKHRYYQTNRFKFLYALLLGDWYLDGKTIEPEDTADLDSAFVDNSSIINIGPDMWDTSDPTIGPQVYINGYQKVKLKLFIEKEMHPNMGTFFNVLGTGELSLTRLHQVIDQAGIVETLDDSNIVSTSALGYDTNETINQFDIKYHWSPVLKDYLRTETYVFAESIGTHLKTAKKELKFKTLHTSANTQSDIARMVERFADPTIDPPYRTTCRALRRVDANIGEVVRYKPSSIKDFSGTASTIDRSMMVVQRAVNALNEPVVNYTIMGSSGPKRTEPVVAVSAAVTLSDQAYTNIFNKAGATDISTLPGYAGGAFASDVTFTGGATAGVSIFYHDGNLTFNGDLLVGQNVLLVVKGVRTFNGDVISVAGLAGGTGRTGNFGNEGAAGGIGVTVAQGGWKNFFITTTNVGITVATRWKGTSTRGVKTVRGLPSGIPPLDIKVENDQVVGLYDQDFRGAPGASGNPIAFEDGTVVLGGDGADGGAALLEINRGSVEGVGTSIVLSGGNGVAGTEYQNPYVPTDVKWRSGTGAPGHPGGWVVLVDGTTSTLADTTKCLSKMGQSLVVGSRRSAVNATHKIKEFVGLVTYSAFTDNANYSEQDRGRAYSDLQFIQKDIPIEEINDTLPPEVLSPALDSTNKTTVTGGTVINRAFFSWTPSTDQNVDKYQIRYYSQTASGWDESEIVDVDRTTSGIFLQPFEVGEVIRAEIRTVTDGGAVGDWATTANHPVIGKSDNPLPPTAFSVTGVIGGITINVTQANLSNEGDVKSAIIYSGTVNNKASYDERFAVPVGVGADFSHTYTSPTGTLKYHWLAWEDTSGNESTTYPGDTSGISASAIAGVIGEDTGPVDLATSQVVNKTADNISYTSAGSPSVDSLEPAEAAADTTGNHIAETWADDFAIDGDMERADTKYWSAGAKSAAVVKYGARSLLVVSNAAGGGNVVSYQTTASGALLYIPVEESDKIYLSGWIYSEVAVAAASLSVRVLDGAKATLGVFSIATNASTATWENVSGIYTVAANVRYVTLALRADDLAAGGNNYFDAVSVRKTRVGADPTVDVLEAGVETDAAYIRNVNWTTTPKLLLDFANQKVAIGSGTWGALSPQIIFDYNAGTPRAFLGDRTIDQGIEYTGTEFSLLRDTKFPGTDCYNNTSFYINGYAGLYNVVMANTGGVSASGTSVIVDNTATSIGGDSTVLRRPRKATHTWNKFMRVKFDAYALQKAVSGNTELYFMSGTAQYVASVWNIYGFGLVSDGVSVYGFVGSSGGYTQTAAIHTIVTNTTVTLEAEYTPGSSTKFYINGVYQTEILTSTRTPGGGFSNLELISVVAARKVTGSDVCTAEFDRFTIELDE